MSSWIIVLRYSGVALLAGACWWRGRDEEIVAEKAETVRKRKLPSVLPVFVLRAVGALPRLHCEFAIDERGFVERQTLALTFTDDWVCGAVAR